MGGESLLVLCALLFLDGATLALFTTPLLLAAGRHHEPWVIALAGAAASAAGSAVQLAVFRWMLESGRPWMSRFLPSKRRLEETLQRYPSASFLAIAVARATPLPDAPLKLVAAAVRYPIPRYLLAILLGSVPYYYALGLIGSRFEIPRWVFAVLLGAIVIAFAVDRWRSRDPR